MKKIAIITAVLAGFLLNGCVVYEKKNQSGAAVEVNGQYLYRSTLDSLTVGLASEDSLRVVQQYVSQWAKDILEYDKAEGIKGERKKRIDALVDDYRRTLYVRTYEEYLVERRMPKGVPDSTIAEVYEQMSDRFVLDESVVKGLVVVVPNDAPNIAKLRTLMSKVTVTGDGLQMTGIDEIEKYVYKNASRYELFTDKWQATTDLLSQIPMSRADVEANLKVRNQIEVSDSLKTYILQVTEKQLRGTQMPLEYARPDIEKIVLNARQVEFLNKERERLYNEAIQDGAIKFYD